MLLPGITNFFKIIVFLFLSWILVHFFAAFGVFVAFAYPIWGLFAPQRLSCLSCQFIKEGQSCPLCGKTKVAGEPPSPKSFRSIILNGLLILVLSFLSLGLVILEGRLLFSLGFPPTAKTVSFLIPSRGQYRLEEIFPMKIEIAGIKTPVNAVQADIGFDPQRLEVVEISTEDSFADIFIQKEINNEVGYARLTGGLPNPGFFSSHGVFGTIFFKGINPGITKVEFLPSSLVLVNDGRGTNVLKDLVKASYLILSERISQGEETQQEALMEPIVLGEKIEQTQMKFYEEGQVLGISSGDKALKQKGISSLLFGFLEKVDRLILESWTSYFQYQFGFFNKGT